MRAYDDAFSVAIADVVLLIVLASASEPSLTAVAEPTRSWRYDDDGIRGGGEGGRVQSRNLGGGIYTLDILSPFSPSYTYSSASALGPPRLRLPPKFQEEETAVIAVVIVVVGFSPGRRALGANLGVSKKNRCRCGGGGRRW